MNQLSTLESKYYLCGGNISKCVLLRFKNKTLFTKSDDKCVLLAKIWLSASENSCSLGTEVAGIERYFLTNWARVEKLLLLFIIN